MKVLGEERSVGCISPSYERYVRGGRDEGYDLRRRHNVFPVDIGLHQGSVVSPFLFAYVMDELTKGIQDKIS